MNTGLITNIFPASRGRGLHQGQEDRAETWSWKARRDHGKDTNDDARIPQQVFLLIIQYCSLLRPQESAEFLDMEGFAHMGDIGYFDSQGLLYFVARAKEMLKVPD